MLIAAFLALAVGADASASVSDAADSSLSTIYVAIDTPGTVGPLMAHIVVDNDEIGVLHLGKCIAAKVSPGKHVLKEFWIQNPIEPRWLELKYTVPVDWQAGQEYYYRLETRNPTSRQFQWKLYPVSTDVGERWKPECVMVKPHR